MSLIKSGPQLIKQIDLGKPLQEVIKSNYSRGFLFKGTYENTTIDEDFKLTQYQNDSLILSGLYDFTVQDLKLSKHITDNKAKIDTIESVVWFLPAFSTLYAGLKNIFAFANVLHGTDGTQNIFAIRTQDDLSTAKRLVTEAFPALSQATFVSYDQDTIKKLPGSTIAVCTLWTTAYDLLKYNKTIRKCYMIQDWEPEFYPRGTLAALAAETYSFGFFGLTGTDGLSELYKQAKGSGPVSTLPSLLDLTTYLDSSMHKPDTTNSTKRVMFYARPDTPRNAFELGLNALTLLKKQMGNDIEIVLAGAPVNTEIFDLESRGIMVAGKVPYNQLSTFYASFEACLFLMYSEHPGVVPLEMMASRVPVVVNEHSNSVWDELYIDGKTCLRTRSSSSEIARNIKRLILEEPLRTKIIENGIKIAMSYNEDQYKKQAKEATANLKRGKS